MTLRRSLPLLLLAACNNPVVSTIPQGTEIATEQGIVRGKLDEQTRVFLGIPFAAPPVGALRFKPPQTPASWSTPRDAIAYGPACPQFNPSTRLYDDKTSEDCLTLNLWTGAAPKKLRPVMVWFHGGAFTLGSGGDTTFDGKILSETAGSEVVVVTINYRLGPLGFAAHPALSDEDPARVSSGNYGLLDQQQALRWVKENIAKFGGDPERVTIFGESAGAISVCDQLLSPGAVGLFHRAIMESGPCVVFPLPARATWEQQGVLLAEALGCNGGDAGAVRACLRAKTAKEVLSALPARSEIVFGDGYSWTPNVDGVVIPDAPLALLAAKKSAKVPLLIGANKDEGTIFFALGAKVENEADMRKVLGGLYSSAQVDALIAQYPAASYPSFQAAAMQALGDAFVCDARRVARLHDATGQPVRYYHFTRAFKWLFPNLGAFHSAEIPFIFGNQYVFFSLQDAELPLSRSIQGYWTRFAYSGDPDPGQPATEESWPAYHADTDQHLQLDLQIAPGTGLRKAACDFWDKL